MKKMLSLLAATMLVAGLSGVAFSADFEGKISKVKGDEVTVEITKGKAAKLKKGDNVKIEVEESKDAPKKMGGSMLQGC